MKARAAAIVIFLLLSCITAKAQYPISWKDKVGVVTNANNEVVKTAADGWGNGGAASINGGSLLGSAQYTVTETGLRFAFGISLQNADANYTSIDYGFIFLPNNQFNIIEDGTYKILSANYSVGDVFKVEKTLLSLVYKKNGVTIRSYLLNISLGSFLVDLSVYNSQEAVKNITCSWKAPLLASAGADTTIVKGESAPIGGLPTASGGSTPYTYSWSPTTALSSSTGANPVASPTVTTSYKVTVTDHDGTNKTSSMVVHILPQVTANAGRDTAIIRGNSVTLGGSPTGSGGFAPLTYAWSPSAGLSSTTAANPVATPTQTTTYVVQVSDHKNHQKNDTVVITVQPPVTANAGRDTAIIRGNSVTLGGSPTGSGGYAPLSYAWSPSAGLSSTTIANPVASPTQTTTYVVYVNDIHNNHKYDTVVVTVLPPLVINAGRDTTINSGASVTLGGAPTVSGGMSPYTYSWSPSAGLNSTTGSNPVASPTLTTTYTVVCHDHLGNTGQASVVVHIYEPLVITAGEDTAIFKGSSAILGGHPVVTGGLAPYMYTWAPATALSSTSGANPVASPTISTTYTLTVTDHFGSSQVDAKIVRVLEELKADAGRDTTIYRDSTVILGGYPTASGSFPFYKYLWTPSTGLIDPDTVPYPLAKPLQTTTYTVKVTDNFGTTKTDAIVINVIQPLHANAGRDTAITRDSSIVLGGMPSASGGMPPYTYAWIPVQSLIADDVANPRATPANTTTFVLNLTDSLGNKATDTVVVTVGLPNLQYVIIGSTTGQASADFPLNSSVPYSWTNTIYKSSDLVNVTRIYTLAFNAVNVTAPDNFTNQRIYMRNTTASTVSGSYPDPTQFSLVYQGDIHVTGNGWNTITLQAPFNYNGTDNIEVLFENTSGAALTTNPQFSYTNNTVQSNTTAYGTAFGSGCLSCTISSVYPTTRVGFGGGNQLPFTIYNRTPCASFNDVDLTAYALNTTPKLSKTLFVRSNGLQPTYPDCPGKKIVEAKVVAHLSLGNDYNYGKNAFSTPVRVRIVAYSSYAGTSGQISTATKDMILTQNGPEQFYVSDFTTNYNTINRFEVYIDSYTPSAIVRKDIQLDVCFTEKFAVDASNIMLSTSPISSNSTTNPQTFNWSCSCPDFQLAGINNYKIPDFQFQLLRLFNTIDPPSNNEDNISANIDWSKALTIETQSSNWNLSLTIPEGTGYYVWRVRAIGDYYPGGIGNSLNWGPWSNNTVSLISLSSANSTPPFCFFYDKLAVDKNWIYSRTFTEGNKINEKINYASGLLQVKQSVSHLQSDAKVLVAQTQYDYAGRPVINSMPAALAGGGLNYTNLFLQHNNTLYTADYFDSDITNSTTGRKTYKDPMTIDAGPLKDYYSNTNTDITIPDGEDRAFSLLRYYPEARNRVKEESSPGDVFKIDGTPGATTHTNKTFYASVSEQELIRIFGDEAPLGDDVTKVIKIDGNGVTTVTYINKAGQTIATCLSENSASTLLDPIPITGTLPFNITENITSKTQFGDHGYSSTKRVVFTDPSNSLILNYQVTPDLFGDNCANFCTTCDYIVTFLVYNLDDPTEPGWPIVNTLTVSPVTCPASSTNYTHTYTLPAGSYLVEKRITTANIDPASANLPLSYEEEAVNTVKASIATTTANDPVLTQIDTYLTNKDLTGLYTYLGTHFGAIGGNDKTKRITTSCCTIDIPVIRCPSDVPPASPFPNFEAYLIGRWQNEASLSLPPNATIHDFMPQYNAGQFNQMVQDMVNNVFVSPSFYTLNDVWKCWDAIVQAYKVNKDLAALNPTVPLNGKSVPYSYDMLEDFIRCTHRKLVGYTTLDFGTAPTPGYLSHPYAYFQYDDTQPNLGCQGDVFGVSGGNPNPIPTSPSYTDWENFYNCIHYTPASGSSAGSVADNPDKLMVQSEDACINSCQGSYQSFVEELKDMYSDPNSGYTIDVAQTGKTLITTGDIYCQAEGMVQYCAGNCNLTPQYNPNPPYNLTGYGDATEIAALTKVMTYKMKLALPDPNTGNCPTSDYESVDLSNFAVSRDYMLLQSLQKSLAIAKADAGSGVQWNYLNTLQKIDPNFASDYSSCLSGMTAPNTVPLKDAGTATIDLAPIGGPTTYLYDGPYLRIEETYPAQVYVGQNITITLKITFKQGYDVDLSQSHFTFTQSIGGLNLSDQILLNQAIYTGEVITKTYHIKIPPPTTGTCHNGVLSAYYSFLDNNYPGDEDHRLHDLAQSTFTICYGTCFQLDYSQSIPATTTTPAYNYFKTVCDDFCFNNTPCAGGNVCVLWTVPDTAMHGPRQHPVTCDESGADQISIAIKTQLDECHHAQEVSLRNSYETNCYNNINEQFSIAYPLGYHHYTLYYYDRAGNLVKTVPPKGVDVSSTTRSQHPSHSYYTTYQYNSLKQLVSQTTPDGGTTHFWYNNKGQLRFSQSAQQSDDGTFVYTKYDALGRVIETGKSTVTNLSDLDAGAENAAYPTTGTEWVKTVYTTPAAANVYGKIQRSLQNRVSYTNTADGVLTIYSYDPHGNVEWIVQGLPGVGQHITEYEYDLVSNKVTKVKYNTGYVDQFFHRYTYDADNRITLVETSADNVVWDRDCNYSYYAHGPLKRSELGEDHLQGMDYVYTLHGWLKGVNHTSLDPNNDPGQDNLAGGAHPNIAPDVYSSMLNYFEFDFKHSGSPFEKGFAGNYASGFLYNGNIKSWVSNTVQPSGNEYPGATAEKYNYDELNRITASNFNSFTAGAWQTTSNFSTTYAYDANGNIQDLSRNAGTGKPNMDVLHYNYVSGTNQLQQVSESGASYTGLGDIKSGQTATNYSYYKDGTLNQDAQEHVQLTWNIYGKVKDVTITKGANNPTKISYIYDAQGNKVMETLNNWTTDPNAVNQTIKAYIRDASGNIMAMYNGSHSDGGAPYFCGSQQYTLDQQPLYGSERLGVYKPASTVIINQSFTGDQNHCLMGTNTGHSLYDASSGIYTRTLNQKQYELKDHLGNVRATISDIKNSVLTGINNTPGTYTADIKGVYNYYPFGMKQPGRSTNPMTATDNGSGYSFGYNGKEQDFNFHLADGQIYDFDARVLDVRLGRWLSGDSKANKMAGWSPYNFSINNPISVSDPDGEFPVYFMIRRYESSGLFGTPFLSKGDARQNSINMNSSARIHHLVGIETNTPKFNNPVFHNSAKSSESKQYLPWPGSGTERPKSSASGDVLTNNNNIAALNFSFNSSGQEPIAKQLSESLTPAIDTKGTIGVNEFKDKGEIQIFGTISGDNFPDAEGFIFDASGNGISLGDYQHSAFGSPIKDLVGEGNTNLINFDINVKVDKKGNFQSASFMKDGKATPLKVYNQKETNFKAPNE